MLCFVFLPVSLLIPASRGLCQNFRVPKQTPSLKICIPILKQAPGSGTRRLTGGIHSTGCGAPELER
jgi:hypothetical protein